MDEEQLSPKEEVDEEYLKECEKNPGHGKFLSIDQCFDVDKLSSYLPEHYHGNVDQFMDLIKHQADLTVKVVSGNKVGTGFVQKIDTDQTLRSGLCKCRNCKISVSSKNILGVMQISTAAHVLTEPRPDEEEEPTICIFFYDSKDSQYIEFLAERSEQIYESKETIYLRCAICRTDIIDRLQNCLNEFKGKLQRLQNKYTTRRNSEEFIVIIVSHPHGGSKRVTIGPRVETNHNNAQYEAATCSGSSGAFPVQIGGLVQTQPSAHIGCRKKETDVNNEDQGDTFINVSDVFIEKKIVDNNSFYQICKGYLIGRLAPFIRRTNFLWQYFQRTMTFRKC